MVKNIELHDIIVSILEVLNYFMFLKAISSTLRITKNCCTSSLSSQSDQSVVGLPLWYTRHLHCTWFIKYVPSLVLFRFISVLNVGTYSSLYDASLYVLPPLILAPIRVLVCVPLSIGCSTSTHYNSCWSSSGSGYSISIVAPLYISHASTTYIPNIDVVTRLSQIFISILRSINSAS